VIQSEEAPALQELRVNLIVGRARVGLSQEDLSRVSGVSRPTISRIERAVGSVGVDVIERLALALGTSVYDLYSPTAEAVADDDDVVRRAVACGISRLPKERNKLISRYIVLAKRQCT